MTQPTQPTCRSTPAPETAQDRYRAEERRRQQGPPDALGSPFRAVFLAYWSVVFGLGMVALCLSAGQHWWSALVASSTLGDASAALAMLLVLSVLLLTLGIAMPLWALAQSMIAACECVALLAGACGARAWSTRALAKIALWRARVNGAESWRSREPREPGEPRQP